MEARTCQVYTGPCFANGETGLAGKDAVMAWSITNGGHNGVDLSGLKVVAAVRASDTLGFGGLHDAESVKVSIMVDQNATEEQRRALVDFAEQQVGQVSHDVAGVSTTPISMELDTVELRGTLRAGKSVELTTRKTRPGDCICSNELAYYPPLAKVNTFAPGVTIDGNVSARGLGSRWSIPNSRSAYMATFAFE